MIELVVLNCGLTERCFVKNDASQTGILVGTGQHDSGYIIDHSVYPNSSITDIPRDTKIDGTSKKLQSKSHLLFRMRNAHKLYNRKTIASEAMQVKQKRNPPLDANHQSVFLVQASITPSQSKTQALAHLITHLGLVLGPPLPPHLRSLDVSGTLVVRFCQHAHDRDEDLLHALDGRPALRGMFVVVGVVAGGMEDRDADGAVGVD